MDLVQEGIDRGVFPRGSDARDIVDIILTKAQGALQHMRPRRNKRYGIHNMVVFVLCSIVLGIVDIIILCYFVTMM